MTVRALDFSSDDLDGAYEVMRLCQAEENPDEPIRTRAEVEAFLRHVPASTVREYWVAEDSGAIVGFAQIAGDRKSPVVHVDVIVHPDARRRGHGARLLEQIAEASRRLGARELVGGHATEAGSRFALWAGAVDNQREIRSLLRLPANGSAAPVAGYELESWVGAAPERRLDSYARAREAINDAPSASDEDIAVWDGTAVRELEAALERRARDTRVTIAVDARGDVVAFTELRVPRALGGVANTEDTAVAAEHRGRGLGRWIKLESLQQLHADRPDVELVTTDNAEQNEPIMKLNRSVGFVPACVYTSCVLQLQD